MNKNLFLFAFSFITALFFISCTSSSEDAVTAEKFQEYQSVAGAQVLDVRTPKEYDEGHIKNALLADWNDQNDFTQKVQQLDKDKPVLVYCASGFRSSKAADWLQQNGFKNVESLKGGFEEWRAQKKPVEMQ